MKIILERGSGGFGKVLHHMLTYDKLEKGWNNNTSIWMAFKSHTCKWCSKFLIQIFWQTPRVRVHFSFLSFRSIREKKIYYGIIYGHMHDLTHRDLFKSKLKFSTVKIAFPRIYLSQTTTSIFHRYRQITSFSQKTPKPRRV